MNIPNELVHFSAYVYFFFIALRMQVVHNFFVFSLSNSKGVIIDDNKSGSFVCFVQHPNQNNNKKRKWNVVITYSGLGYFVPQMIIDTTENCF